jgi:hypothetical protein
VSDGAILGPRALNRALLARQGLLDRVDWSVTEAVDRLVGLQAQVPHAPFVALWSRLAHFDPAEVDALLEARRLVRAGVMRGTIHLLSPADCVGARQALEPLYAQVFRTAFGAGLRGADPHAVRAAGEALLTGTPMSRTELSAALAPSWPQAEPASLGQAVVHHAHVVQVPPRGLWRRPGPPVWARTADWVGEGQLPEPARVDDLVLRYLAAFGPATAADVRTWSRITGLRPVIEALRPRLRTFRDAAGRELLDVPDGLLPPPETPAPPRFLPEFDNITLSHDDRARILDGREAGPPLPRGSWTGTLLVDGFARANWSLEERRGVATLAIDRFRRRQGDPRGTKDAVRDEAVALARFIAPDAARHEVRFDG